MAETPDTVQIVSIVHVHPPAVGPDVVALVTEGLSTYEEKIYDPSWDRYLYRDLYHAYHAGALLPVLGFDAAFGTLVAP